MSSIEPSLQPSFKFPSRHNNANYAKGLLDQSAASQLLLVRPKRNTDISLETPMQSTLTTPKVLDKDVIDVKPVFPVDTAIYVQPGLAEGMTGLAKQTAADVEITKITSGNNALKRGNYIAAEHLIGRQLTQEEIANRTQTPNTRSSESNPNKQSHVDFSHAAFGVQVAPGHRNFQERENLLKKADRDLVNRLADHYGLPPDVVTHVKTSLGFTGDSVLGAKTQYSERELQELTNQFLVNFTKIYGMHPEEYKKRGEKVEIRQQPVSNIPGENRPIHSGRKADREAGFYRNGTHFTVGPKGYEYVPDPAFYGRPDSVQEQLSDIQIGGPPDLNDGDLVLNPQSEYQVQDNVNAHYYEDNERKFDSQGRFVPPTQPNDLDVNMPDAEYERRGGMQAEFLEEVDMRDPPSYSYEYGGNEEVPPYNPEPYIKGGPPSYDNAMDDSEVRIHGSEKRSAEDVRHGPNKKKVRFEEGAGFTNRPARGTKYHRFVPQTDSFSDKGAVVSGHLMHNTGVNAVPISAQVQVANTHQLYETPLRDWVKHPNYTAEVRPDPIPISQNMEGVSARKKKVKLGGYMIDHHKLLSQNVLSVSHPTGRKVKSMPNVEVSNPMKEAIHNIITGGKVNTRKLKAEEKLHLRDLLHKSAANVSLGADVNVSPTQQLHLILGEIEAGNDSPELKSQLKKLLPALKRSKCISAEQCTDISKHYL